MHLLSATVISLCLFVLFLPSSPTSCTSAAPSIFKSVWLSPLSAVYTFDCIFCDFWRNLVVVENTKVWVCISGECGSLEIITQDYYITRWKTVDRWIVMRQWRNATSFATWRACSVSIHAVSRNTAKQSLQVHPLRAVGYQQSCDTR